MLCHMSLFIFSPCRHVTFYKTFMSLSTVFIKAHVELLRLLKWPCRTSLFTHAGALHWHTMIQWYTSQSIVDIPKFDGNLFSTVVKYHVITCANLAAWSNAVQWPFPACVCLFSLEAIWSKKKCNFCFCLSVDAWGWKCVRPSKIG